MEEPQTHYYAISRTRSGGGRAYEIGSVLPNPDRQEGDAEWLVGVEVSPQIHQP